MAPLIIAHRGDSAHRPENTLVSFASALEAGADLVEADVQLTKDGHVGPAMVYVLATVAFGLAVAWIGSAVARYFDPRRVSWASR